MNAPAPHPWPVPDALADDFYAATAEGRLLIQRCESCEAFQFYPRAYCAGCGASDPRWHESAGRGIVHTFTVVHYTPNHEFAADCPYVLGVVALEEGVHMTARIVGVDPESVRCDLPVQVEFYEREGFQLPAFSPREGDA